MDHEHHLPSQTRIRKALHLVKTLRILKRRKANSANLRGTTLLGGTRPPSLRARQPIGCEALSLITVGVAVSLTKAACATGSVRDSRASFSDAATTAFQPGANGALGGLSSRMLRIRLSCPSLTIPFQSHFGFSCVGSIETGYPSVKDLSLRVRGMLRMPEYASPLPTCTLVPACGACLPRQRGRTTPPPR